MLFFIYRLSAALIEVTPSCLLVTVRFTGDQWDEIVHIPTSNNFMHVFCT